MAEEIVTQASIKSELPSTAKRARELGYKRFFNEKPCKRGHVAERLANNGGCLVCHNEKGKEEKKRNWKREKEYTRRNQQRHNEYCKKWVKQNPESRKASVKKYYEENKKYLLDLGRDWRRRNPERQREAYRRQRQNNIDAVRESAKKYKKKNRAFYTAAQVEREANKKQATPTWADKGKILAVYEGASRLSEQMGEAFDVDHIVPLKSDMVCGLHVQDNLQVLHQSDNSGKGNRWWPDMPEFQQ